MKLDPNEVRLVSLTNYEILLAISLLRKVIPNHDDQQALVNIVQKLEKSIGLLQRS